MPYGDNLSQDSQRNFFQRLSPSGSSRGACRRATCLRIIPSTPVKIGRRGHFHRLTIREHLRVSKHRKIPKKAFPPRITENYK
jgi:hypothetical protein